MSLPEFAQISEENELLRDQLREMETWHDDQLREIVELKAEINELKAQLSAKEEGAITHWQTESRDGWVWRRPVIVIEGEWEQTHRAVA